MWTCFACESTAFLLEYQAGATTIHCANCNVDVTQHILSTLPVAVDLRGESPCPQ